MKKKLLAVMMTAAMLFGLGAEWPVHEAQAAAYSNLMVGKEANQEILLVPGETITVELPVRAVTDHIMNPKFSVELSEEAPFEVSKIQSYQMIDGKKWTEDNSISYAYDSTLEFTVTVKENAKIGRYDFAICYADYQPDGTVITEGTMSYDQRITLTGVVTEEKLPAELAISNLTVSGALTPGSSTEISFTVTNNGEIEAKNVCLSADYSGGALLPEYTNYTRKLGDMKQDDAKQVSLKVKILENVTQQLVTLPLQITYKDSDGVSYTADDNNVVYLNLDLPAGGETKTGALLVNHVSQFPEKPKAGEKVTLTFFMENTGEKDDTETKLFVTYTPGTGFEPVNAEPYQYVGTIRAGEKKKVSVQVIAGAEINAGMNTLGVNYTYLDGNGEKNSESVDLYVLNVQEKESLGNSKPKLMVSEFSTSIEQVKAGEEFDFQFEVYNTHSETTAKNIKVTVTSEMFSVTKGSNSFFLQSIAPGESEAIVINLKASAAATTGSYPVNIQMEYEYDGMTKAESSGDGVVVTETKMLLIKENLRVSVENVSVGGWSTPYANQSTPLSFSIYNMGKSMLNNVFFTVEGDFEVANGSSYYYGTLQAGYPDYVEMDIIPLTAGDAVGTLTIHMEDSNGDEVTYTTDISAYIMEMGGDIGWEDPGEMPEIPVINSDSEEQAKPIVSLPVFIAADVILFLVSLFVTRGIRLACYKKKLKKDEE